MIKPKITIKTKDKGWAKIKEMIERSQGGYVTIGVHEDAGEYQSGVSVAQVALWNEFGTEKIPERSFFRTALDENTDKINAWREQAIKGIVEGKLTPEKALESIGFKVMVLIQNKIKSNVPPPNAPSTVTAKQAKGVAPNTLIDSGLMLRSITYKVFV